MASVGHLVCLITKFCYLMSSIGIIRGQSVAVTESIVIDHVSDYEYDSVPNTAYTTSQRISAIKNETTKTTSAGDDGLFYPLYDDAINVKSAISHSQEHASKLLSLLLASSSPAPFTQPSIPDIPPDYSVGDEITRPKNNQWGSGFGYKEALLPYNMQSAGDNAMWGGDLTENLRKEFRIIKHYGLVGRLDELQAIYPSLNVTRLYNSYSHQMLGGDMLYNTELGEYGKRMAFWNKGNFINFTLQEADHEADGGFWHNNTFYPFVEHERDGGFWYNQTFYPGEVPDIEEGFYYNGTFYPVWEFETPDLEDGFFYNGTFYPGLEETEEEEGLMWWQLHHPRWRDRTNDVEYSWGHGKWPWIGTPQHPPISFLHPKEFPTSGRQLPSSLPTAYNHQKYLTYPFPVAEPPVAISSHPFWKHHHTTLKETGPSLKQMRRGMQRSPTEGQRGQASTTQQRIQNHFQRKWANQHGVQPPHSPFNSNRRPFPSSLSNIHPVGNYEATISQASPILGQHTSKHGTLPHASGYEKSKIVSGPVSARSDGVPLIRDKSNPLDPYRNASTAAIGIIFACILALTLILAPLTCLLHNYRQNKRMKNRTLLRRPEFSSSVDDGLVDALVRTELGAVETAMEPEPSAENRNSGSQKAKSTTLVGKIKARGMEAGEKRSKSDKGWSKGQSTKMTKGKSGDERHYEIEMRELRNESRDSGLSSRPLPSLPSSSSPRPHPSHYEQRNSVIGLRDELSEGRNLNHGPMSAIGLDSEDEVNVVGK